MTSLLDKEMDKILVDVIEKAEMLKKLKFDNNDKKILGNDYYNLMVHIALEKADIYHDRKTYDYIMNKFNKNGILDKHIEYSSHFNWHFKKND